MTTTVRAVAELLVTLLVVVSAAIGFRERDVKDEPDRRKVA